jgi:hypothetical protein
MARDRKPAAGAPPAVEEAGTTELTLLRKSVSGAHATSLSFLFKMTKVADSFVLLLFACWHRRDLKNLDCVKCHPCTPRQSVAHTIIVTTILTLA